MIRGCKTFIQHDGGGKNEGGVIRGDNKRDKSTEGEGGADIDNSAYLPEFVEIALRDLGPKMRDPVLVYLCFSILTKRENRE